MIQIKPGDVIALEHDNFYYYCIVLTKIIQFGGNLTYVFNFKTKESLSLDDLLKNKSNGYNAIVDFIWAKRQKRVAKLGKIDNYNDLQNKYFKACYETKTKARFWFIYDGGGKNRRLVKRVTELSEEEKKYPFDATMNDLLLYARIDKGWLPENDVTVTGIATRGI